jgi:hypothetical protein
MHAHTLYQTPWIKCNGECQCGLQGATPSSIDMRLLFRIEKGSFTFDHLFARCFPRRVSDGTQLLKLLLLIQLTSLSPVHLFLSFRYPDLDSAVGFLSNVKSAGNFTLTDTSQDHGGAVRACASACGYRDRRSDFQFSSGSFGFQILMWAAWPMAMGPSQRLVQRCTAGRAVRSAGDRGGVGAGTPHALLSTHRGSVGCPCTSVSSCIAMIRSIQASLIISYVCNYMLVKV